MKAILKYQYITNEIHYPCGAITEIDGQSFSGVGKTWEECRESLMEKIKKLKELENRLPVPADEEIEI